MPNGNGKDREKPPTKEGEEKQTNDNRKPK